MKGEADVVMKEFLGEDRVDRVKKFKAIYKLLKDKNVPNVDKLDSVDTTNPAPVKSTCHWGCPMRLETKDSLGWFEPSCRTFPLRGNLLQSESESHLVFIYLYRTKEKGATIVVQTVANTSP